MSSRRAVIGTVIGAVIDAVIESVPRLLFPPRCALCDEPCGEDRAGPDLCAGCHGDLPRIGRACRHCGEPLDNGSACVGCGRHPPPMDRTVAPFRYAWPADWLLTELKFNARLWHGPLLAALIAEALAAEPLTGIDHATVLIPVPLHQSRLTARGYNQALEIARPLARRLGCRLAADVVVRDRATREQSSLSARARRRNVAGAFRLRRPADFEHAVIVDDVVTTGATTKEIAALLLHSGCARVSVVAAARAAQRNT